MRISDWSSDVCSSDLRRRPTLPPLGNELQSRARGGFATMAGDRTSEPGMTVTIGIARETAPGERRVAVTPETCRKLVAAGANVRVERGLGDNAHFPDAAYADAGAELVGGSDDARAAADITLCVQPPEPAAIARLKRGAVLVGSLQPEEIGRAHV